MKILALCNVSNVDDPSCDSGLIFQKIIWEKIRDLGFDYQLLAPAGVDYSSFQFPGNLIQKNIGTGRYSSRFNFDWNALKSAILEMQPDIIFNNQVEITSALRALLIECSINCPIVTYCHYPALWEGESGIVELDKSLDHSGLGYAVVSSIFSAVQVSDAFIIQSEFAKSLLQRAAMQYNISFNKDILVIPPPCDPCFLSKPSQKLKKNRQTIVYNHRLYQSYGTQNFIDLVSDFQGKNFKFVVSNPMPHRSKNRSLLNDTPQIYIQTLQGYKNVEIFDQGDDRKLYKQNLASIDIGLAAFRKSCVWSMASIDCLGLGIPVIAPNYAAYPEFIPKELLFSNINEAKDLIKRLSNDQVFWMEASQKSYEAALLYKPETITAKLISAFRSCI